MRLLFLLFTFLSIAVSAQTDTIKYFDAFDRKTYLGNAVYYRKVSKPDTANIYIGTEYWMDGHLKVIGYSLDSNFLYKIVKYSYYYKNGNKSGEGQYYSDLSQHVFGFKNKKWETWYPNGKPKEIWVYKIAEDFSYNESLLMTFWDTAGKQLTVKGEGRYYYADWVSTKDSIERILFTGNVRKGKYDSTWSAYYSDGTQYAAENFKEGKLINGKSFDRAGNEYRYDSIETAPQFPGGEKEWNNFINLNTQGNRDAKLQADISVRFFIGRNGYAGNILEIHAPAYARAEVSRVIKLMPRFKPATTRGQAVDSYYTAQIPVQLTY